MILDQIQNIGRYRGFSRGLDVLIDWLGAHDCAELEVGRHDILGDKVFANVQAPTTRPASEAHFETHARYMDVQVDVNGREAFRVAQGETVVVTPFDAGDDFGLCDAERFVEADLDESRFVVFLVGEPHMPTLEFPGDGAQPIKKICFKVLADEFFDC